MQMTKEKNSKQEVAAKSFEHLDFVSRICFGFRASDLGFS
jgi:hypothetical protein